ncbi:hypothetical protein AJ78_04734 [Emergomyces pasteurianus Ep9510]|uniref:Uncharacterized protein n=1 Tax=Emergomyces pasteurianus Ep9510 TaxID=1447872 RepID=A0A1J9Q457_9EURO|nr:hypothetical protein AJ78_04734 [Emergomyces pasteurianus Ep9510]
MTEHLPSPHMLSSELSKHHTPQMDLKETVYTLAAAALYAKHSKYVESLEEHTTVLRRGSSLISNAPVWFNIGSLWALIGDLHRAMDAYELSINEDREFTIAWFCKGICHFLLQEYGESKNSFRKCSSTFKILDFVLAKDDVAWNTNVANRRYKMQGAWYGADALEPKLRRGHLNLFLGPHKDCFKLNQMFQMKCRSILKGAFSLIPSPSIIRKNSCCIQRKCSYVVFPEMMQEDSSKVVLKIPVFRRQSTESSNPQKLQPTANATGLSRFPSVISRKQVPTTSTICPRRGPSSCERTVVINTFLLPPPTLRRRGHIPGPNQVAEQAGARKSSEGLLSPPQILREQISSRNSGTFPLRSTPNRRSAMEGRVPLPSFVCPPSPQPGLSTMQHGLSQISTLSTDNTRFDNNHDVIYNTTTAQPSTLNAGGDYNNHTTQQNNDRDGVTLCVVGFDRKPEKHYRTDPNTRFTTASAETSVSLETFYSAPDGMNNRVSAGISSTSSSKSCSVATAEVLRQDSKNWGAPSADL